MGREPAESVPLTDVYVCGVMEPDDPAAPLPKLRWSLFAERVGIAYDRHPRLSYRTFYLEDCT